MRAEAHSSDIGTPLRPIAGRCGVAHRGVVASFVLLGLFLGLQMGASFGDHTHATYADGVECVACHGVRVAPPAERSVEVAPEPEPMSIEATPADHAPIPSSLASAGDPPRGPPSA